MKIAVKKNRLRRSKRSTHQRDAEKPGNSGIRKTIKRADPGQSLVTEGYDPILTVPMLGEYLHCHPSTIYRLLLNKKIPGFRLGSDWRFRKSAIDDWMKKRTVASEL